MSLVITSEGRMTLSVVAVGVVWSVFGHALKEGEAAEPIAETEDPATLEPVEEEPAKEMPAQETNEPADQAAAPGTEKPADGERDSAESE